jgi:NAD(P)-dependent dehydrogenase (short-subunit alcohol dehydrogenase family)
MLITDKVLVVTGGGNGIGREVVLGLLAQGAKVAAVDLSEEGLAGTVKLAGADPQRLRTYAVNVTDRDAVAALPERVIDDFGAVDGLLNIAGIIQKFVTFNDLDHAEIERVMAVNFWGVANTCKAFLPHLLDRPEACLLNISSMGALVPVPGQSIYGASKAAVKLLTEGLHAELKSTKVAVTVVFPGGVGTNIAQNSGAEIPGGEQAAAESPPTTMTDPAVAGLQIVDAVRNGTFRVTIGKDARTLDRMSRIAPRRSIDMVANRMKSLLG